MIKYVSLQIAYLFSEELYLVLLLSSIQLVSNRFPYYMKQSVIQWLQCEKKIRPMISLCPFRRKEFFLFLSSFSQSVSQFSRSVVSDSLQPHEPQHARPPCPSPSPGVHSTHVHWVGDAIQPSHPLSSPFPPVPNPSQHQSLFQ